MPEVTVACRPHDDAAVRRHGNPADVVGRAIPAARGCCRVARQAAARADNYQRIGGEQAVTFVAAAGAVLKILTRRRWNATHSGGGMHTSMAAGGFTVEFPLALNCCVL